LVILAHQSQLNQIDTLETSMKSGAQPGNNNAGKSKPWRDAITWAIENHPKSQTERAQALRDVALKMIDAALAGDMSAIKELGDRLDGKAPQDVNVDFDLNSMPVSDLMDLFNQLADVVNQPDPT
jgi:hypothetical protein